VVHAAIVPNVPESRVLLVDARDLDPAEVEFLAGSAIRHTPVDAVVEALPEGPVHLHVDADVVDPRDLPGLLFPAPDGPRLPEVLGAVRAVLATVPVVAVTIGRTWRGAGTADPHFAARSRAAAAGRPRRGGAPARRYRRSRAEG
jgi:arginase